MSLVGKMFRHQNTFSTLKMPLETLFSQFECVPSVYFDPIPGTLPQKH